MEIPKELLESSKSAELIKTRLSIYPNAVTNCTGDIINVDQINFSDDETWLYKHKCERTVSNVRAWLHEPSEETLKDLDFHMNHLTLINEIAKLDSAKKIDSRTYVRPKKRFSRPSLNLSNSQFSIADIYSNTVGKTDENPPLNFDLSQPVNNIFSDLKRNHDADSFQNMSPPSLVSSSMFSSIMENSYIKTDPVLREIRDTDYTDVILKGCNSSVVNSLTCSCSSVDSDTPEGFLNRSVGTFIKTDKKVCVSNVEDVLNGTYIANESEVLSMHFQNESNSNKSATVIEERTDSSNISSNKMSSIFNNTYNKTVIENLNDTFNIITHTENGDQHETIIINNEDNLDSNKLNYSKRRSCIIENARNDLKYGTYLKNNRRSFGSNDSLDYTSSLSNSSSGKGSSKILNMADVDAIVLQQEKSLLQVMSTPKSTTNYEYNLTEYTTISPIRSIDQIDSDGSSNDDYHTVGSGSSKSLASGNSDSALVVPSKNLDNIKQTRNIGVLKRPSIAPMCNALPRQTHYGSYTHLHKAKLEAQQNLTSANITKTYTQSNSNLKTMDTKLKGSYTQLKPVFTNLPTAAATNQKAYGNNLGQTKNVPFKVPEVALTPRDQTITAPIKGTSRFSALPRPVSGIPRPSSSRIPGPPRSGIPTSRTSSKVNINADF